MNIELNGVHYFYEVKGTGEPLLLLHGFTGDSSSWKNVNLDNHYKIITIDLIGHGQTESPQDVNRYKMEQAVNDIVSFIQFLNIDKVNLLGYSMGGRLALSLAMLHPNRVKRLILESSSPGLKTKEERLARMEQDERLAQRIELEGIESFVRYWENIPLFATQRLLSKEAREAIRKQRLNNSPIGLANSLRGMGTGSQPSWWKQLYKLSTPTLLLCGELDRKFHRIALEMDTFLPESHVSVFPKVGHTLHLENVSKFNETIHHFLQMS